MSIDEPCCSGGGGPDAATSAMLLESFNRITGRPLAPAGLDEGEAARWLYEGAPFCILAHNTAADPRFFYANKAAQRCFEYSWAEFIRLPSRLSAEAPDRAERQAFLDRVARDGFAGGYDGLRVSRSGRRFFIRNTTLWQLVDHRGVLLGQGAMIPAWQDAAPDAVKAEGVQHVG